MRAMALIEPGVLRERASSAALPDDRVAVAVAATGICGTDLHAFEGRHSFLTYPRVLGHEIAGTVATVGRAVAAGSIRPGARVVVNPFTSCGVCRTCRRGWSNLCPSLAVTGVHVDGGFAEVVHVAPEQLVVVPDELDLPTAALVEPLSIGAEAINSGGIAAGDHVVIVGAGPIGLACLGLAAARGADVLIVDRVATRLEHARALGAAVVVDATERDADAAVRAFTEGLGADVVIEAVGTKATIEGALRWVAPGGCFVLLGLYAGNVEIPAAQCIRLGLRLVATRLNRDRFPEALTYLQAHPAFARVITHQITLGELPETMARLARRELDALKVLVRPSSG